MTLGNTIKKLREENNLTQEYMADRLGIQQSTYSKIERDEIDLTISKVQKIAQVYNVNISKILNIESNYTVHNDRVENSPIGNNNSNHYTIDSKVEYLYEANIKLLKEKNQLLLDKIQYLESKK